MAVQMASWGVPREKIHAFGIPVPDLFFSKANRTELLTEFGPAPGAAHRALYGRVLWCDEHSLDLQGPCAGKLSLPDHHHHRAEQAAVPHVPQADPPLAPRSRSSSFSRIASPITCTRAICSSQSRAGLTVSEALACSIPLAVFDAIPGQEGGQRELPHRPQHGDPPSIRAAAPRPPSFRCWRIRAVSSRCAPPAVRSINPIPAETSFLSSTASSHGRKRRPRA